MLFVGLHRGFPAAVASQPLRPSYLPQPDEN